MLVRNIPKAFSNMLLLSLVLFMVNPSYQTNLVLKKLHMCEPHNDQWKFNMESTLVEKDGVAYLDGKLSSTIDLSNDIAVEMPIEQSKDGKTFNHLMTVKNAHACSFLASYLGQIWLGLIKDAGVPNYDKCPLQGGNYEVKDHRVDLSTIKTLPSGLLRGQLHFNKDGAEIGCLSIEASSLPPQ